MKPGTWCRQRMGLELNDRMLCVPNGRRRRRLLVDVAIGNIRHAFVVGVFTLISKSTMISILSSCHRIKRFTHIECKCRKAFGRRISASQWSSERITAYCTRDWYLSLPTRRTSGPGALPTLLLVAFSIALGTWRPLHLRAFRRHRPRFCHPALRERGERREKSGAADVAGLLSLS